ncbi:uncharacterized protein LOC114537934 [Dendronephthya gigantea]|uniref:uncharacterized protein LOC114537934 n=1 Tax=Dendronephthya gigantea TaxID=151771 RepID=UPI00106CB301|nr:uncharacterized protein LOC114537934 [Dendronephthya gigantea]
MKIFVLITLIAATIDVGIATFSERPGAVELRGKGGRKPLGKRKPLWRGKPLGRRITKLRKTKPRKTKPRPVLNFKVGKVCPTDGFRSPVWQCACNFAGGCDLRTNVVLPHARADPQSLNGIAPKGLDCLALGPATSVGTICEGGTVAVLYDCNARSALYAASMINGANFKKGALDIERKDSWKKTKDMTLSENPENLATNRDYIGSSKHIYCYEDERGTLWNWDGTGPCNKGSAPTMAIHKGHLIAARYGKTHGTQDAIDATFSFTNAVPQEGSFNSNQWRIAEGKLIEQAKKCQENAQLRKVDAKMYVVVGVIPSSFLGKPKFFGSAGFGSYQGEAGNYRISFPEIMWTAACCIHTDGSFGDKFGFWRRNNPSSAVVNEAPSPTEMFKAIRQEISKTWPGINFNLLNVFPSFPACN